MKYWYLLLIIYLFVCSCNNQQASPVKPAKPLASTSTILRDPILKKYDSLHKVELSLLNLPDIKQVDHEAYQFTWGRTWTPSYFYFIEKNKDLITLKTRCASFVNEGDTLRFTYNNKLLEITSFTVLDSSEQTITIADWKQFKSLLAGSYFWLYNNNDRNSVTDGEGWTLQSRSYFVKLDSLCYSSVALCQPYTGGFYDACAFLIKHSKLTHNILFRGRKYLSPEEMHVVHSSKPIHN